MSFVDFKEVSINNPGTASFYGSDDLNEVMKILNGKIVSNRQVKIKNPWQFQDNYDVVAAAVVPANPGANSKRFYVDPTDNHFKMKSSGGSILDFDVLGAGAQGEANLATNVGTAGVGPFKQKTGITLEFKKINAGSSKVTVTDDTANSEVDIDITEVNLLLQNLGGVLTVPKGGTGVGTHTNNGILKGAGTGNITAIAPGTDGHILTMVSGAPAWAAAGASTDTKAAIFENGIQIGTIGRRLNFSNPNDFTITEDSLNDRFNVAILRRDYLAVQWQNAIPSNAPAGTGAYANVGTTYVDALPSAGDGVAADVSTVGMSDYRFALSWDKNGGTGTHSCRIVRSDTLEALTEITNCVNGKNTVGAAIPAPFLNNVFPLKIQMKSTIAGDDPIFRAAFLYLR